MGLNPIRVYFDSCIVNYLIEEHPGFAPQIENYLNQFSNVQVFISGLSEMESLILPLRNENQLLVRKFQEWFQTANVLSINTEIFKRQPNFERISPV